ncbi:major facilitator superfamily isoform A [Micractinium conductrix]|uniref:Major facilitator superfamily isoform A n=1 Tax=Micractinium conductrix TaxID=554055 RepID=A0A2P6VKS5_9CHLO|nr:major facilitator superfamily isoform A [Micractinium conductrix]|eukprot:PSC74706.1 major facilitator superfamily isoform A [Micractinium conductrix]
MASVVEALGALSLSGLAELAAYRSAEDWAGLPNPLLGSIFRRLLEQHSTADDVVRCWETLALVCKGWLAALQAATPMCLELTRPVHLSPAARRWLSRVPMEALGLSRTLAPPDSAAAQLLASEQFRQHSASALRSLSGVGFDAAPLLHHFAKLKQVTLYCGNESEGTRRVDASLFHSLPKLSCLTIAGYWGALDTSQLPTRLKHLALSNYNEAYSLQVVLPDGMHHLELLSVRADSVVLDWRDVCQRCDEISLAAHYAVLGVGVEPLSVVAREMHLYRQVGAATLEGEHFQEACLAFFHLLLFTGPLDQRVLHTEADDFLQVLRDDLLPQNVDVNPALEVFPDFVRDEPSSEACFVLELVKQEAGKPKSLHFTTPVTDAEVRLLTSQPCWRISWCEDPRAAQVLADPQFVVHSAATLTDLLSIPLVPELDLRPFAKLTSLLGMLRCSDVQLARVLRRLPRGLESLCLTAEVEGPAGPGFPPPPAGPPRDFDAGTVRHLRNLREMSLYGYRRHDLRTLRKRVNIIRVLNPVTGPGEVIGSGRNYAWPEALAAGGGSDSAGDSGSDSEWETEEEDGGSEAGSEASGESFGSASSELRSLGSSPRGAGSGAASPAAGAAAAAAAAHAAAGHGLGLSAQAAAGAAAGGAAADGGSSDSSSSDSSDDEGAYVDAEHGHGHRHRHGMEDEEQHSQQTCQDAFCPLHSGKSFLQVSLTDERPSAAVDFSALLAAGFQMLTVTLSAENPHAQCTLQHEGHWRSLLASLESSSIEVLELNCQAASMTFRSTSLPHRLTEVRVEAAMRYVVEHYSATWQVKSWSGNTASDGVVEGSRGPIKMAASIALPVSLAGRVAPPSQLRSKATGARPLPLMGMTSLQRRNRAPSSRVFSFQEGKDKEAAQEAAPAAAAEAAAAAPASLSDLPAYPPDFVRRRLITFVGIVLGYSCFYLTRNSLTYTAPAMVADPSLAIGMSEIGTMTSIFPIAYGFSKFVSGVLGSRTSPSMLLAGGLIATAALNVAFGFSTSLVWFCTWWALNGMLQGVGAPCCARILTSWFAAKERGTYWGMWNIAHNMGGFLAPILAGTAAKMYGWQWGMFAPGIVGTVMGLLILLGVRDSPESIGYPPVETRDGQKPAAAAKAGEAAAPEKPKESLVSLLVNDCLKNPYVVGLALTYFFIYIVRQGVTSWFVFYLLQVKGVADAGAASLRVSGLELGGLFGSLLAGKLSDMLINNSQGRGGNVGKRIQVVIAYTLGIAACLAAFAAVPASLGWMQWATVFMIGFFLYGPQMMIGLCGAELVRPESVGASQGFLGWVAYLGAANAGIPLSIIVKDYGWGAYFTALLAACAGAVLLLAPMINAKSYVQLENERKLAAAKLA